MSELFEKRIDRLVAQCGDCLGGGKKGVEKESLRVDPDGLLSTAPHPAGLGSALTNRYVTTDFSEALLEFVTPAYVHTWEALQVLCDIHQFTYRHIGDEYLWVTSMPCALPSDSRIPLARYGNSNVAKMKTVYRNGLGYRYGRNMQTIAGIHFNYSLPDGFWPLYQEVEQTSLPLDEFRSDAYLSLVRNFRRMGWLVLYLFGASPALCKTFAPDAGLPLLDDTTYYQPFATSLRMSDLGYSNKTQSRINISLNSLPEYIEDLSRAIATPEPDYEKIGVVVNGEYRQLSANQLQIENEYYSSIRPKRVARSGERPTTALRRGGVEYVEVRSLDLNLFDPAGVSQNTMRFVEAFLVYCLLEDSPAFDDRTYLEAARNHARAATDGRDPGLRLRRHDGDLALADWASEIIDGTLQVAELIDNADGGSDYADAVRLQAELVAHPDLTPSAKILQDLADSKSGFFRYAYDAAVRHKEYFASIVNPEPERLERLEREARESLQRQQQIEREDTISFEEYLARYYAS